MSFSFVKASANNQTLDETLNVWTYELSKIYDLLFDFKLFNDTPIKDATVTMARTEMADYLSMTRMTCEQADINFDSLYEQEDKRSIAPLNIKLGRLFINHGLTIRGLHYIKRFNDCRGDNPQEKLKEVINYCRLICTDFNWNFWELYDLGESRYKERMRDLIKTGIKSQLKKEYQ